MQYLWLTRYGTLHNEKRFFFYILLTSIRHSTDAENYKLKFDYESEECGFFKIRPLRHFTRSSLDNFALLW